MSSDVIGQDSELDDIRRLFEKTQSNIRRIQHYGGEFYYPVLNEWRYVTEYAIRALVSPSERKLAITELRERLSRAHNDSCLVLADCCLSVLLPKIRVLKRVAVYRAELRDRVLEALDRLRSVRKARMEFAGMALDDKNEGFRLVETLAALKPVFDLVAETEDFVRTEQKRRLIFRLTFLLGGVLEVLAVIVFLLWKVWR